MNKSIFLALLAASSLHGASSLELEQERPQIFSPSGITLQNRILVRVQGKPISARDLLGTLDETFERNYAEYVESAEARHQYYLNAWKPVLNELISRELILADAEEHNLPVAHTDVREEMERIFGSNMLEVLDNRGLTFEQAWDEVRADIAVRRMMMIRVNSRAFNTVTPGLVQKAYDSYCQELTSQAGWRYRTLTIRAEDSDQAAATAAEIARLIHQEGLSFEEASKTEVEEGVTLSLSKPIEQKRSSISQLHREALELLTTGEASMPLQQQSRTGELLFRLYLLEEELASEAPPFKEVENALQDRLIQQEMSKEQEAYFKELYEKFEVENLYSLESSGQDLFLLN